MHLHILSRRSFHSDAWKLLLLKFPCYYEHFTSKTTSPHHLDDRMWIFTTKSRSYPLDFYGFQLLLLIPKSKERDIPNFGKTGAQISSASTEIQFISLCPKVCHSVYLTRSTLKLFLIRLTEIQFLHRPRVVDLNVSSAECLFSLG